MNKYRTKVHPKAGPVHVEAEQFTDRLNAAEAQDLADRFGGTFDPDGWAIDFPLPSFANATPGYYLVRHEDGSVVVLPSGVFETRFEADSGAQ